MTHSGATRRQRFGISTPPRRGREARPRGVSESGREQGGRTRECHISQVPCRAHGEADRHQCRAFRHGRAKLALPRRSTRWEKLSVSLH